MIVKFYKYHGAGNDFILIDGRSEHFAAERATVAALCHRRFGIGADGLMLLENDSQAEFYMRYFNSDGGESTMCGNGGRSIALFAHHLGIGGLVKEFNSIDGLHRAEILSTKGGTGIIKLQMIDVEEVKPHANGYFLNTGSPHYVEFVDDLEAMDVPKLGREIRYNEYFGPKGGTNVNFVKILGDSKIAVRTYERGVEDETWACGTGVTAAAIATASAYQPDNHGFTIQVKGGTLDVAFQKTEDGRSQNVFLTGPAALVFEGEIAI